MESWEVTLTETARTAPSACPTCGSESFSHLPENRELGWVSLVCGDCGLSCQVMVGPDSAPWDVLFSEWEEQFPSD